MSLKFKIFPDLNLAYIRYEGIFEMAETALALTEYAQDPKAVPGTRQLVDLSQLVGYEKDYAKLIELQMQKIEIFMGGLHQTLMTFYAPTPVSQHLAQLISNSWTATDSVIIRVLTTEEECLEVLGIRTMTFRDLNAAVS